MCVCVCVCMCVCVCVFIVLNMVNHISYLSIYIDRVTT